MPFCGGAAATGDPMTDGQFEKHLEHKLLSSWGINSYSNTYYNWKRKVSVADVLEKLLRKPATDVAKILEVGCGEADVSFLINSRLPDTNKTQFYCVDMSSDDLRFAGLRAAHYGYNNFKFELMDIHKLQYGDGTFDAVICCEVVEHLLDPLPVLKEIFRVLKPGGTAVITTPNGGLKLTGILGILKRILTLRWKEIALRGAAGGVEPPVGANHTGFGHVSVFSGSKWSSLIRQAGFKLKKLRGTGGIIYGNAYRDPNRMLTGLAIAADSLFDRLPCSAFCSEILQFNLVKPRES